jgi:hypothetical protein
LTTNVVIARLEPRSTVSWRVPETLVQNLSLLPPPTEPLTAFAGASELMHGAG